MSAATTSTALREVVYTRGELPGNILRFFPSTVTQIRLYPDLKSTSDKMLARLEPEIAGWVIHEAIKREIDSSTAKAELPSEWVGTDGGWWVDSAQVEELFAIRKPEGVGETLDEIKARSLHVTREKFPEFFEPYEDYAKEVWVLPADLGIVNYDTDGERLTLTLCDPDPAGWTVTDPDLLRHSIPEVLRGQRVWWTPQSNADSVEPYAKVYRREDYPSLFGLLPTGFTAVEFPKCTDGKVAVSSEPTTDGWPVVDNRVRHYGLPAWTEGKMGWWISDSQFESLTRTDEDARKAPVEPTPDPAVAQKGGAYTEATSVRAFWSSMPSGATEATVYRTDKIAEPVTSNVLVVVDQGGWDIASGTIRRHRLPEDLLGKRGYWVTQEVWALQERADLALDSEPEDDLTKQPCLHSGHPEGEHVHFVYPNGDLTFSADPDYVSTTPGVRKEPGTFTKIEGVTVPSEVEALKAEVEALKAQKAAVEAAHQRDMEVLSDVLIEEANDREWCSEYDEIISGVNSRLKYPLKDRDQRQEFEITLTVTYTVNKTVMAMDEYEAKETAKEEFDRDDLMYASPDEITASTSY